LGNQFHEAQRFALAIIGNAAFTDHEKTIALDALSGITVGSDDEGLTTQTCVEARMIITVYLKVCVKLGVSWKWR